MNVGTTVGSHFSICLIRRCSLYAINEYGFCNMSHVLEIFIYRIWLRRWMGSVPENSVLISAFLALFSVKNLAISFVRRSNDDFSNVGSWSITLRASIPTPVNELVLFCSYSQSSKRLYNERVNGLVWVYWLMTRPLFRTNIRIVKVNEIWNEIEIQIRNKVRTIIVNETGTMRENGIDIFYFYVNVSYITGCHSQICHLSRPDFSIAWTEKWNAELEENKVRLR